MANYSAVFTLTTPASTLTLNASSGDTYLLDPTLCSGLDMAPLRTPIDDKPQAHGGIVHNFWKGARHVTLSGLLYVVSASTDSGVAAARNTLEDGLVAALESILQADGTLQFTPSGGSSRSLTVRCDVPVTYSGGFVKNFVFGLVAANPVFS